ncbi:hypothetical protein BHE74_00048508 [Ensete ventricosum]|nr:hypothetical protein BHE74_00048508 [Ensete ventricosum]
MRPTLMCAAAWFITDLFLSPHLKLTHSSITLAKVQIKSTRWPQTLPGDFLYPPSAPHFRYAPCHHPQPPILVSLAPCRPPHPINQALDGSRRRFGRWDLCLALPLTGVALPLIGLRPPWVVLGMLAPRDSLGLVLPQVHCGARLGCPCKVGDAGRGRRKRLYLGILSDAIRDRRWRCGASMPSVGNNSPSLHADFLSSAKGSVKAQKILVSGQLADKLVAEDSASRTVELASRFTSYQEDPLVDKLRTQLGVIHSIPSPPINKNIVGFFVFFFFIGVAFDKVWTSRKRNKSRRDVKNGTWPQVPTSFSIFFEKDLQRKESVEWVNMVLGKLWKVYRSGIENWIIGLLQPVIDDLKKPSYVQRVEIKQFSLGDEPLSVRNVERRTSRRVNDLHISMKNIVLYFYLRIYALFNLRYQIGLRYTGGARMLLLLSLKFGIIPIVVPVGIRDFDIDGELWVKLRLIPTEPWIGAVSWAFVSLPKIKFELSPFRLFNLMAYVEDEEDGIEKELVDTDASDDESSEYIQADELYEQSFSGYPSGGEAESFMDVLAALLVSEEFRGIVSSETGTSKVSEQAAYPESPVSRTRGRAAEISTLDADSSLGGFKGTPPSSPNSSL